MSKKGGTTNVFSVISLVVGLIAVAMTGLYMVYRFLSDKAYHDKWKDYDDCGLA